MIVDSRREQTNKTFTENEWYTHFQVCKVQVKQSLYKPWEFQEAEAPRFQENWHMMVVRLSALRSGRVYPPGNIASTNFC
jgi:hypothetical protein